MTDEQLFIIVRAIFWASLNTNCDNEYIIKFIEDAKEKYKTLEVEDE